MEEDDAAKKREVICSAKEELGWRLGGVLIECRLQDRGFMGIYDLVKQEQEEGRKDEKIQVVGIWKG